MAIAVKMKCIVCGKVLKGKQRKFCSLDCKSKNKQSKENYKNYQKEYESRPKVKNRRKQYSLQPKFKKIVKIKNQKQKNFTRNYVLNYKRERSCQICGFDEHTEILQFHHKNHMEKSNSISRLVGGFATLKKIKEEIVKCILICPNCHMWIHYSDKGAYTKR